MQLPDVIDRMRPSIVQIRSAGPGLGPTGTSLGTGFIVTSSRHIITARHVVAEVKPDLGQGLQVAFALPEVTTSTMRMRGGFLTVPAQVVDTAPKHDLALIEIIDPTILDAGFETAGRRVEFGSVPVKLSAQVLRPGTALAVSGYPLSEPSLVTNAGILASTFTLYEQDACYLGDFTANPGNSGGPVYATDSTEVVGVCVAGRLAPIVGGRGHHAAGLTLIAPAAQVLSLLQRNRLNTTSAPP